MNKEFLLLHYNKLFLECLNEWTTANIAHVNFSKCTFLAPSCFSLIVRICDLKNLRSLNLSYTELNQNCFEMICEDLKFLERLDISGCLVLDLKPLLKTTLKLVYLAICVR